jgi:L1 cell adhesion molecule like protein
MNNNEICIGVDLGTTYSCVGIFQNGNVDIVIDPHSGNRTIASYVSFTENERLIGNIAKAQSAMNAKNTIYDSKRFIGMNFSDPKIQEIIPRYPFKIKGDKNDKIYFEIEYKGETKKYFPEEIGAMLLSKMKEMAEEYTGKKATKVVITIPAHFSDSQRNATKDAGKIAGFEEVLRIINEPTSAGLAYGLEKNNESREINILIVDIGGGTTDMSILTIDGGLYETKGTAGDKFLGGSDFDNYIVDSMVIDFKKKFKCDPTTSSKSMKRFKNAAETIKKNLSSSTTTTIEIESVFEGNDYNSSMTRAKFEQICELSFKKCIDLVKQVLKDTNTNINEINEIVLVGGSSRIPKIQSMLSEYFNGKILNKSINPDEAVCYGACIQAAILTGVNDEKTRDLLLVDCCSLNLGIKTNGAIMTPLIEKNSSIPTKKSQIFSTAENNQPAVTIDILEGISPIADKNRLLGRFNLDGIPPMPRGVPEIEVTFALDANSILTVTAVEKSTGATKDIIIKQDTNKLSKEEIDKMIEEAEKFKDEDNAKATNIKSRNSLENLLYNKKNEIDKETDLIIKDKLTPIVDEGIKWLDNNSNESTEKYEEMIKEFNEKLGISS